MNVQVVLSGAVLQLQQHGKPLVTIDADGKVLIPRGTTTDDATKAFWEAVALMGERHQQATRNLLALIHGDGGHYTATYGLLKSLEDAQGAVINKLREAEGTLIGYIRDDVAARVEAGGATDAVIAKHCVGSYKTGVYVK